MVRVGGEVDLSGPVLPSAKNALLRATVTVEGAPGRRVTFALGEPGQPRLVVDADVKGGRYVSLVVDLVVGVGGD